MRKYLKYLRPYLLDIIDDLKTSVEWKVYLTMKINFGSTPGFVLYRKISSLSDKSKIMIGFDTDEIIKELFTGLYLVAKYMKIQ